MIGNNLAPDMAVANMQIVFDAADKTNKEFETFLMDVSDAMLAPDGSEEAMVEIGEDKKVNVHSLPGITATNVRADLLSKEYERAMAFLDMVNKSFNQLTSMAGNM
jgi:hypothetical protein